MDGLDMVVGILQAASIAVGTVGGILGVASFVMARRKLNKADAETDAMWSILQQFEAAGRAGGGNVICVDVGTNEQKLLEKAVDKGILQRDAYRLGCYSMRFNEGKD